MNYRIKREFDRLDLLKDAIQIFYQEYIDFEEVLGYEADWEVQYSDTLLSYSFRPNDQGDIVPILIFNDESQYSPLYRDYYIYVGTSIIDNTVYDKWQKVECEPTYEGSTHIGLDTAVKAFIYTNILVETGAPSNYLHIDSNLTLTGSITSTMSDSGYFRLYKFIPYDWETGTQEDPLFINELLFTTDPESASEDAVCIPDLLNINLSVISPAWSSFFEDDGLYYISANLTDGNTSWSVQSNVVQISTDDPSFIVIDLHLSDNLILTGTVNSGNAYFNNPNIEIDLDIIKDGESAIRFNGGGNGGDDHEDFTYLQNLLSNGLDLKGDLSAIEGSTLECKIGSEYSASILIYGVDDTITVRPSGETVTEGAHPIYSNTVLYTGELKPEIKYFNNTELNSLWNRLVNAINILSPSEDEGEKSWQLIARTDGNYLYIKDGYLKVQGDPWTVTGPDATYSLYPDSPVELSLLNTEYSYNVYSSIASGGATLIYADSSDIWGPVTFDNSTMQGYVWLNSGYNVLETIDAIEYTIYDKHNNAVKSGCSYYDPASESSTTPLTDLPNGNYVVKITSHGASGDPSLVGREGTLTIGNQVAKEGTIAWVHDKLITRTQLTRNNKPTRPADYMRGIAVCARYLNNVTDYLNGETNLETIVTYIEKASVPSLTVGIVPRLIATSQTMQLRLSCDLATGTDCLYKIEIYDDTAVTRLVASKTASTTTNRYNIADIRTIYDAFNLNGHYRVKVTVTGPNNQWGYAETDFVWSYDTPAGGGDTGAWPTPIIEVRDGRIYVLNYTNTNYICDVETGNYADQEFGVLSTMDYESIENGYTSGYYEATEDRTHARLAIRIRGGSTLTEYSNIVELKAPCNSCGSYETEYDSSLDLWLCSDCQPNWRLCDYCGTPNDYNAWIDNLPESEAYICEDCETNGVGFCSSCGELRELNAAGDCTDCEREVCSYCGRELDRDEFEWDHIESGHCPNKAPDGDYNWCSVCEKWIFEMNAIGYCPECNPW